VWPKLNDAAPVYIFELNECPD